MLPSFYTTCYLLRRHTGHVKPFLPCALLCDLCAYKEDPLYVETFPFIIQGPSTYLPILFWGFLISYSIRSPQSLF